MVNFGIFLYTMILKQKSFWRRSEQAANLLKKNSGFVSTRFTKPSVEQIIGYGYDHPQKMMDVLINIWLDTKNIECGQNVFDLPSQGLLTSL